MQVLFSRPSRRSGMTLLLHSSLAVMVVIVSNDRVMMACPAFSPLPSEPDLADTSLRTG